MRIPRGWYGCGGLQWKTPPSDEERQAAAKKVERAATALGYVSGTAGRRKDLLDVLDGVSRPFEVRLHEGTGPALWYLALFAGSGRPFAHTKDDKAAAEDLVARWNASTTDPNRSKYDAFNDFLGRFGPKYKDGGSVYALIKKDRRERGDR